MDLFRQKVESARKLATERHEQLMRDDPEYRKNYREIHEMMEALSGDADRKDYPGLLISS